MYSARPEP